MKRNPVLAQIIRNNRKALKAFIKTGKISDGLYQKLFDYYLDQMPYGTAKARTGDPYEWISKQLTEEGL